MATITPAEFREIQSLIRKLCGLVLTDDKQYLVLHRLESVLTTHGCRSFTEYLQKIARPECRHLRDELVECLTTAETSFFRDGHPFEALRSDLLPAAWQRASADPGVNHGGVNHGGVNHGATPVRRNVLRILSAACSTGQEVWSVGMVVRDWQADVTAAGVTPPQVRLVGADISQRCLTVAREGRYSAAEIQRGLPAARRDRYLKQAGTDWIVGEELRGLAEFRQMNLLHSLQSLGLFDLILCRNVLIYFDQPTRQEIVGRLCHLLHPGGCLLLGAAESLLGLNAGFAPESAGNTTFYVRTNA